MQRDVTEQSNFSFLFLCIAAMFGLLLMTTDMHFGPSKTRGVDNSIVERRHCLTEASFVFISAVCEYNYLKKKLSCLISIVGS